MTKSNNNFTRRLLRLKPAAEYLAVSPGTTPGATMVPDDGSPPTDQGVDLSLAREEPWGHYCRVVADHFHSGSVGNFTRNVGKDWLAGNWSVRKLVDRLEQVGVKIRVAGEKANYGEQTVTGG